MAKRNFYFRCQYQRGEICVSEIIEDQDHISVENIFIALARLAVKVSREVDRKTGEKVALQVLKIHEFFMKSVEDNKYGTGSSKSHYINEKSKNKKNSSERVDIECFGEYGLIKNTFPMISKYIEFYRKMKGWIKK